MTKSDRWKEHIPAQKTLDFIGVDPDKTKNKLMIVSFLDTYCTIIEEKRKLNYETIHVKCHACDGAPCRGHHGETKSEVVKILQNNP